MDCLVIMAVAVAVFGALMRDLVPFVQFKKHEKHPWRNVTGLY